MFQKAVVRRVQQLHETGRQLAVLKRMYQSYALIIERILSRQKPLGESRQGHEQSSTGKYELEKYSNEAAVGRRQGPSIGDGVDQAFVAPLTAKAIVKFERLKDRIDLYALSEIQECLDEKDSLVFLVRPP